MKTKNKPSAFAGFILFILAALFFVATTIASFDFGVPENFLLEAGKILSKAYGYSSFLIPCFLIAAGVQCFSPSWSRKNGIMLLGSIVPFITATISEKIIFSFLKAQGDPLFVMKMALAIVCSVLLLVVEFLVLSLIGDAFDDGDKPKRYYSEEKYSSDKKKKAALKNFGKRKVDDYENEYDENDETLGEGNDVYQKDFDIDFSDDTISEEDYDFEMEEEEVVEEQPKKLEPNPFEHIFDEKNSEVQTVQSEEKYNPEEIEQASTGFAEKNLPIENPESDNDFSIDTEIHETPSYNENAKKFEIEFEEPVIVEPIGLEPEKKDGEDEFVEPEPKYIEDEPIEFTEPEEPSDDYDDEAETEENSFVEQNDVFSEPENEIFESNEINEIIEEEVPEVDFEIYESDDEKIYPESTEDEEIDDEIEENDFDLEEAFDENFDDDLVISDEDDVEDDFSSAMDVDDEILSYHDEIAEDDGGFRDFSEEPENPKDEIEPEHRERMGILEAKSMSETKALLENDDNPLENLEDDGLDSLESMDDIFAAMTEDAAIEPADGEPLMDLEDGNLEEFKEPEIDPEPDTESIPEFTPEQYAGFEPTATQEMPTEQETGNFENIEEQPQEDLDAEGLSDFFDSEDVVQDNEVFEEPEEEIENAEETDTEEVAEEPEIEEFTEETAETTSEPVSEFEGVDLADFVDDDPAPQEPAETKAPIVATEKEVAEVKKEIKKPRKSYSNYKIPTDILDEYPDDDYKIIDVQTQMAAQDLQKTLQEFKIEAEVTGIRKGPVVTMFELLPAPGVKLSKIVALQDNIALRLAASSVRIVAPIPGKHAVGIEVPNKDRSIVGFREIIEQENPAWKKMAVPAILGKDISGSAQIIDIAKTPHLLIAGATGAGKSVCVNSLILSILYKRSPAQVKMILIDPKIVELKLYNDIPHLLVPVITEPKKAMQALQYCLCEMERRYAMLDGMGVRDITSYNNRIVERKIAQEKLPYLVVIIDEFADLMATTGKEMESTVARLAAMSRAVGIHLVLATQRPSVDVITGLIKANIPSRIAFMVAGKMDSRIIIDQVGAEKLLGKGDMLYTSATSPFPVRIQGTFISDDEVESVVDCVKSFGGPEYIEDEVFVNDDEEEVDDSMFNDGEDPLYDQALQIVVQAGKASTSYVQRRLKIGYNRAARLVEEMEARGIVGPANGSKPREVIHAP